MINLSQETEALAKRPAATQSLTVEDAVRLAVEEKARAVGVTMEARRPRDQSPEAVAARARIVSLRSLRAMPVLDPRPVSEIVDDLNAL
jgi:hypothetical protein